MCTCFSSSTTVNSNGPIQFAYQQRCYFGYRGKIIPKHMDMSSSHLLDGSQHVYSFKPCSSTWNTKNLLFHWQERGCFCGSRRGWEKIARHDERGKASLTAGVLGSRFPSQFSLGLQGSVSFLIVNCSGENHQNKDNSFLL